MKNPNDIEKYKTTTPGEADAETIEFPTDPVTQSIRAICNSLYDMQAVRIGIGNRLCASINAQLGQKPGEKQEEISDKEKLSIIKVCRQEYARITDAYAEKYHSRGPLSKALEAAKTNGEVTKIQTVLDLSLIQSYENLLDAEKQLGDQLAMEVQNHVMWNAFFKDVQGCGPLMSAVCISYLNPYKARHVSSFWKYAGLDTVTVQDENGELGDIKVVGRQKWHTEEREYIDRDGNKATKRGITYQPVLKTKLVGVLMDCFLKKPGCKYERIYRNYRNRIENRPDCKDYSKKHIHRMSCRYAIKQFLRDLWVCWRTELGLPVTDPYEVEKLGNAPHGLNAYQVKKAQECGTSTYTKPIRMADYTLDGKTQAELDTERSAEEAAVS